MRYVSFEMGGNEYKLRLTAQTTMELEKRLGGQNPLNMLMAVESGQMPPQTSVLLTLHAAMQKFHHGMTLQKVMEQYDEYVDSGKDYTDLIPVITEVFEVSGFFPKSKAAEMASL
ncbi:DUF6096 family protein [Paenibacillus oceani]|uniref:Uncharacterized protein n=1 Tax=Paenibacillus oceani TaxID=2772510 RepID=A0A927C591_9BACL|nr:DUF6096 family protein [Paenibacillus oceani]MBD2861598.1 hypothetical protein [Paenibacillus oceani]